MRLFGLLASASLLVAACGNPPPAGRGAGDPAAVAGGAEAATGVVGGVDLVGASVADLRGAYRADRLGVAEAVSFYLARVEALDGDYRAVIAVSPRAAAEAARLDSLAEARPEAADSLPLFGVPVWLKDNVESADGLPTTAGARVLADADAGRDAALVERLRAAGAVVMGKTNLSEWANFHSSFSSSGYSGVGGQTRNAVDTTRSPCGSSSGSAVAVALGYGPVAVGTETNGSIVCPAHANGVVGLKPTVGLVSRRGVVPISESQDTPGPIARSVADAAAALTAMQGVDPADRYTAAAADYARRDYTDHLAGPEALRGKRLGLYTAPLGEHFRVDTLVAQTVRRLEAAGAEVVEVDDLLREPLGRRGLDVLLYEFRDGVDAYLASLPAEARPPAGATLAEVVAVVDASPADLRYFDHQLLRDAAAKGPLTEEAYVTARREATRITGAEGIDRVVAELGLDALIAPTGGPAWKIDLVNGDHFALGSSTPAAVAGYPNLTVPMGRVEGLPVGLSFFGPAWSEPALVEVGSAWEALRGAAW